ncbi:MAG: polysaccharide biosynthesis protein [Gammaproteobacteria bacterium]|nr:polysaccharide biosynthesis protein [Gammaproteobacteria bacterium]
MIKTDSDMPSNGDENIVQLGVDGEPDSVLARIKSIRSMAQVQIFNEEELQRRKIVYAGMPDKKLLKVYRDIRTQLLKKSSGENFVLLVTSAFEGGGASFNATNIAAAFSLDEAKTSILVDCNLHNSMAGNLGDFNDAPGLTDYLVSGDICEEDIIYSSGVPRVRVVPAGSYSESGAEYVSSERMKRFIQSIKKRYPDRFIVIDSPSLADSSEARILADLSDYVLIVVPRGKVSIPQIKTYQESIERNKIVGYIFND